MKLTSITFTGIDEHAGLEKEVDNWRHQHFHGKRDDKGANGEYLTRKSQLALANHIVEWCMSREI